METTLFRVGDRVQSRTSGVVPEGTPGSICHVLRFAPRMYYVQFAGYDYPQLMHRQDLEQISIEREWGADAVS
jgi:hypothetical protein